MVFITFFGFSAIAASAGEVNDPVKTIPRAIFLSMGIDTVLYTLVVVVVHHAPADIMLVKQTTHEPLRRLLLPTAGGEHARCAEEYLAPFVKARDGELTVCSVAPTDADEETLARVTQRLTDDVARISKKDGVEAKPQVIRHSSVSVGILHESRSYDAVVLGAAGHGAYQQILFGSIPETIAKRSERPVILVKHHHPVKALLRRVMADEP
jgi:nucleotide-binding universal stress UspA family protein